MESDKQPTLFSQNHADDNMECEGKLGDFCLVCFSKVDRSKIPKQDSLLSNNLHVIFLLKKVLQVPTELLIGNFKKCGSPAFWINLCEHCSQLTGEAMERHLQILTLVNQLRSIVKIITDSMRGSSVPSETLSSSQNDKKSMEEKRLHILKSTREFVTNYHYNIHLVNPFIKGDKPAWKRDEKEISVQSADKLKEEDSAVQSGDDNGGGWQELDDKAEIGAPLFHDDNLPPRTIHLIVGGKWKCRQCGKLFLSRGGLGSHMREKHPSVPGQFKCDICGKRWNSKSYLRDHRYKVHKDKMAASPINIDKPKETPIETQAPVTVNQPLQEYAQVDGKWKCRHCEKEFKNRRTVIVHLQEKHPSVPNQFICDICGRTWISRTRLLMHRHNVHQLNKAGKPVATNPGKRKDKPKDRSTCHLCGELFSEMDGLRKHLKYVHEKQFDIRCHVCGMGMWTSSYLKQHLLSKHKDDSETIKLMAEGAKLWKCQVKGCRARYWKESRLEEHRRKVHGGGGEGGKVEQDAKKRFSCSYCGKGFWNSCPLKRHETQHKLGKERPYSCDVCGAKFKAIDYVRKHKRRFHTDVPM